MRGGHFKSSQFVGTLVKKPRLPRAMTVRDVTRKIYADATKPPPTKVRQTRNSDVNVNLVIERQGKFALKITGPNYTFEEARKLEAFLKIIGAGKTAGTVPERLVAKWLVEHGYVYGGANSAADPYHSDWTFQQPLAGGRGGAGGGSVADIFITPRGSNTGMGVVVRVNGAHWHLPSANQIKDSVERLKLVTAGYRVEDIWDYSVLQPGALESKMQFILGAGYKA